MRTERPAAVGERPTEWASTVGLAILKRALRSAARLSGLASCLVAVSAPAISGDGRSLLRMFESGETIIFRASDFVDARHVSSERGGLAFTVTPEASERFRLFTSRLIGQPTVGVFDGQLWMTDIIVRESIESPDVMVSGVEGLPMEAFVARLDQLRADPVARDTPMIVLFEQRATIDIALDDLVDITRENETATVCLDKAASSALAALDNSELATWHLALADRMIDDWRYLAEDANCPLRLYDIDPATLAEAGLPGG